MTNATHLGVGDILNDYGQFDALPVGTVITEQDDDVRQWTKQESGLWLATGSNSGGPYRPVDFSLGYNRVLRLPDGATPPPQDTLLRYQWKYRCVAISGMYENGVSQDAVNRALAELGVGPDTFPMGPGVLLPYSMAANDLPVRSVISNGMDTKAETYSLWLIRRRNDLQALLGRAGVPRQVQIVQYPGVPEPPEWWLAEGGEADEQQIAEFKAEAYRIGMRVKREQSWCGTYDSIVSRVGVSARAARALQHRGHHVGGHVTRAQAAELPVGSVLIYRDPNDVNRWGVFVRSMEATNQAGYVRHAARSGNGKPFGHVPPANSTILSMPATTRGGAPVWELDVPAVALLALLPPGTRYTYGGAPYRIAQDGRSANDHPHNRRQNDVVPERGDYDLNVFNSYPVIITSFPEESA